VVEDAVKLGAGRTSFLLAATTVGDEFEEIMRDFNVSV